jgi:tetrapyrrole methylase family protein/MazG family protein/ATP diphosphatase
VVFHARIAEEQGSFAFDDVVEAICDKMIRRHPHVFNPPQGGTPTPLVSSWESIKSQERAKKGRGEGTLSGVPAALPALTRAVKLSKRAAGVGFVWATTDAVLDKVREELGELEAEIKSGDLAKAHEELGDLLFVCANLARDLNIDPEAALQAANAKFIRRFSYVEQSLAKAGLTPMDAGLEEMDRLWNVVRAADKAGRQPV